MFDDPTGKGEFDYSPIELIEDSNTRYSWATRTLANNLIKKNFDPFAFPPDASAEFNVEVTPGEDFLYMTANIKER